MGSLVLIAVFLIVFIKASTSKLIRIISALLFASNLATVIVYVTREQLDTCIFLNASCRLARLKIWVHSASFSVQDFSFALGYWMLANEYFQISRIMPFVVKEESIPEKILKGNKWLNRVLTTIIVLLSLAELPLISITWKKVLDTLTTDYNTSDLAFKVRLAMNVVQGLLGLMEIVTGIILMSALVSIRNFIQQTG